MRRHHTTKRNKALSWVGFILVGLATYVIVIFFLYVHVDDSHDDSHGSEAGILHHLTRPTEPSIKKITTINGTDFYSVCLEDQCLNQVASKLARPFQRKPSRDWCIPASEPQQQQSQGDNVLSLANNAYNKTNNHWQGLLLVKVPKAASSTCAGVALRIAHQQRCAAAQWEHKEGYHFQNRAQHQHVLIGSIRQPGQRAFSSVWFFQLAPLNITPTDANVIRALNTRRAGKTVGKGGYQYDYLSIERVKRKSAWDAEQGDLIMNHPSKLYQRIQRLTQTYHFLIVVERMDESLTALALLLDIPLSSVVVPSSKVAQRDRGANYYQVRVGRRKGQCVKPRKEPMSTGVQEYLHSKTWLAMNYADEVLYRTANASLDRTIDQVIGRNHFDTALAEYQRLKTLVQASCGPIHGTGCTQDGNPVEEACYDRDFGCGYQCLDAALKKDLIKQKISR